METVYHKMNNWSIYFVNNVLENIKKQNLKLYLDDLFDDFYMIQEKFDRDCKYDQEEDILWV